MSVLPERPAPPWTLRDRTSEWLRWVGPARVAGSAATIVVVVGIAYWLVRPTPASTESKLPFASAATSIVSPTASTDMPTSTSAPSELVVHVAGAVVSPGVYHVAPGARVIDLVNVAGGLLAEAEPDAVNLAALVHDGERVDIPRTGEVAPPLTPAAPVDSGPALPINVNSAGVDELDDLPGVGPATAAAIVAHREQYGPFASVDDLADVRGIGPAKLEALRGLVTV